MNTRMLTLARLVNDLVEEYGYDAVNNTLDYIHAIEVSTANTIRVRDINSGAYAVITTQQYNYIKAMYRAGNKIQAIKALREYTNLGLKEAKDIVENTNW